MQNYKRNQLQLFISFWHVVWSQLSANSFFAKTSNKVCRLSLPKTGFNWLSNSSYEVDVSIYKTFICNAGVIHLVRTQNFPKNQHFLPPDMHTYVCVSWGKKCWFFGKFCVRTKWMIPCCFSLSLCAHWIIACNAYFEEQQYHNLDI